MTRDGKYYGSEGDKVTLECSVMSAEKLNVYWFRGSLLLVTCLLSRGYYEPIVKLQSVLFSDRYGLYFLISLSLRKLECCELLTKSLFLDEEDIPINQVQTTYNETSTKTKSSIVTSSDGGYRCGLNMAFDSATTSAGLTTLILLGKHVGMR